MHLRVDGRLLRVGHRGAAALEPENTLRSLARAVELGCDLVEFDVIALRDGTLVVAHSDDLLEVSHGAVAGRVTTKSLAALRDVAPEVPTLQEALELVAGFDRVGAHVDLKESGFEAAVAEAIRRHGLTERALVSTIHPPSLLRLREIEPAVARGLTYPVDRFRLAGRPLLSPIAAAAAGMLRRLLPGRIERMLGRAGATAAMLHFSVVSSAVVEHAHSAGAAVFAWTVDDPVLLARMAAAGVDGVITNDPRIFASADYTQSR